MVEHILRTLSTVLKQKVKEGIDCLEKRYSRTRLQKLEELVIEYIRLREDDHHDEDDLLQVILEFKRKKGRVRCIREWMECSIDAEKSSKEKRNGTILV